MSYTRTKNSARGTLRLRLAALALAGFTSAGSVFAPVPALASSVGPGGSAQTSPAANIGPGGSGPTGGAQDTGQSTPSGSQNTGSSSSGSSMSPNAYKKVDGVYRMADGTTPIHNVLYRGIDVSHWKQDINWNAVAADDIQFVMLGTRYKGGVDPYFHKNAREASAAGLKLGAYIYSYAQTPEEAAAEADFVLDLIKDYPFSMPIAYDMEDSSQTSMSKQQLADLANAFCSRISAAGYYPMIYANDYWMANYLDISLMNYDVWIARYGAKPAYSGYTMWQATSSGKVNGVNGSVDIDFLFKNYQDVIPANLWRNIGNRWYYYQDHAPQSNGWIHDGSNWYYLDQNGQYQTGWLDNAGKRYYLEASGAMASGWRFLDDGWRYFKPSGYMASGWVLDGDLWYYLNSDGFMQTGWIQPDGNWYYLHSSGAMASGWINRDGAWYYLRDSGAMATGWIQLDGSWYYLRDSGAMATGWIQRDGSWYYLRDSGAMATGWIQPDGSWYYLDGSGRMMTGLREINGNMYYFSPENGRMTSSTQFLDNGTTYTADENGVCRPYTQEAPSSDPSQSPDRPFTTAPDPSNAVPGSSGTASGGPGTPRQETQGTSGLNSPSNSGVEPGVGP